MSERASIIRRSFLEQADLCEQFGSPFTARLIRVLEGVLNLDSMTGRAVLSWEGPPEANGDALALRLCGALHALILGHQDAELAAIYPPNEAASENMFRATLLQAIDRNDAELVKWLKLAPQTNEVGRSSLLFLGLLEISRIYRQPLRLFEIGSSAGLNLALDHYGYDFGGARFGDTDSALQLEPEWSGPSPADGSVRVEERRGCDLSPINLATDRIRLQSYVWPDQKERHQRLVAAIDIAQKLDLTIDQMDADSWVKEHIREHRPSGRTTVLMHSLTYCYLRPDSKEAIAHHMESLGNMARNDHPLAWLGFELNDDNQPELTLQTWPIGEKRLIAKAHPHGRWIDFREAHEVLLA
jgi:hypothetical protein